MTATPGQAARETFGELGADWYPGTPWSGLHEDLRAQWEATAQAVLNQAFPGLRRQLDEARARELVTAAERDDLAARADKLRDRLTEVLGWFASNGGGHYARISGTLLAREYTRAGLPLPDSLSHLAGQ